MSIVFNAPIPGQSLTSEPKNLPFERPPQTSNPVEALDMHIDNITDAGALKDAFYFLEAGLPLNGLVEGILRSAVMAGRHSIDVSLVIAPVLHEYIRGLALDADVEFKEFEDEDEPDGIEYSRDVSYAREMLKKIKTDVEEEQPQELEEELTMEIEEESAAPQGLMARRQ